jgi:hypothetical protein
MSKKLIAVASAAAIALSALVGVAPAQALVYSGTSMPADGLLVTGTVSRSGDGTLAVPYLVPVPSSGIATSSTMMRFALSTTVSRAFTVTSTSGIKLLDAVANTTNKYTAASGSASYNGTTNATGQAEFYAFPTSTTRGVVTITIDGDITQVYVTGTEGTAYNLVSVTLPTFELSKAGVVVGVITDMFGNPIVTGTPTVTTTVVGTGSPSDVDLAYSTTSKRWEGTVTPGATAGQIAVQVALTVSATDAQKAAFGEPKTNFFGVQTIATTKTVAELTTEVNTLKAAVATLTADYNALVKRWNKRVADKKAPKKKVATK